MTRTFVNEIGGASARSFLNEPGIFVNEGGGGESGPIAGFIADRVMVSNATGFLANSVITTTELGFLSGVSQSIQTQLNSKYEAGNVIVANVGTAAGPGLTFVGRANTGIFSPAANVIAFTTAGTEDMRIDAIGNVGIGTTSPTDALHVIGNVRGTRLFGVLGGLTASRALATDATGNAIVSAVTATQLGYLSTTSSDIQTQLNARVSTGAVATLSVGTAALPGVTFTGRTNTGIYSPAANIVGISTSGAEKVRIDALGNVGIGIAAPTDPLHVAGNIRGTRLLGVLGGLTASRALTTDATGNTVVSAVTDTQLGYVSGVTSAIQTQLNTKYEAGNTLVANAGLATSPGLTFTGRTTNTGIFSPAANVIAFSTSGTEDVRIDALGNVGIRTTAPQDALHVVGNIIANGITVDSLTATSANLVIEDIAVGTANVLLGTDPDGLLRGTTVGLSANGDAIYLPAGSAATPSLAFSGNVATGLFVPAANVLCVSTTGSERLRVTATGNVGIGTSAPTDPLHVVGNARATTLLGNLDASYLQGSLAADFILTGGGTFAANGAASSVFPPFTFDTDTQSGMFLASSGNVCVTTAGVERARFNNAGNLSITGTLFQIPNANVIPATNGQLAFEVTNNTTVTLKLRGTDGTVRSLALTLA
jgi:hypothetical protein